MAAIDCDNCGHGMDCGHADTGDYAYTGGPSTSRSMRLVVRYPGEIRTVPALDTDGLWVTAFDPEGMECEVSIVGLTLDMMRRIIADTDRYTEGN